MDPPKRDEIPKSLAAFKDPVTKQPVFITRCARHADGVSNPSRQVRHEEHSPCGVVGEVAESSHDDPP